jgi:hypothetical protein
LKKILAIGLVLAAVVWVGWGLALRAGRPPRPPPPAGEARGAWHVHTTRSDGRGTLDEVVRAARQAGLQFVVVSDHNVLTPGDAGYHDGVLVIEATEASTRYGHVVALGVARALTVDERDGDPLGAIAALGGVAVVAHPLHPKRPFQGWGRGPWRGFEVVSNDTAWYRVLADRDAGKLAVAALEVPWDPAGAVLTLGDDPTDELARFDAELRAAPSAPAGRPARVLFCSADAHGYPSYRAAFEAFSMHVPVRLGGDAAADTRAVVRALVDGAAACVFDGLAPASGVRLARGPGRTLDLELEAPARTASSLGTGRAAVTLVRDGVRVGARPIERVPGDSIPPDQLERIEVRGLCGAPCAPGAYRAEVRLDGEPWILTNPVMVE